MRIEEIETFVAETWLFVRITTDTGTSGIGESTFFGWPRAAEVIVESFRPYLLGKDPFETERHWLALYRAMSMRGMGVTGALSAVDQALWDIKGRHLEVPVWQLLGGRARDRVRAMLVLPTGSTAEVVRAARAAVDDGYTAVKVLLYQHDHHMMRHGARIADLVARAAALREAVGWEIDLGIELHRNMVPGEAVALAAELERFRPLFVEDPIAPDSVLSLGKLATKLRVPLAVGERNTTLWEFGEYVEHGGVAYIRPDIGVAGGFTQVRKICALAEAHHQGVIPHAVPSGPVATAAHVHLGVAVPNVEVQEHRPQRHPPWSDVVDRVVEPRDGFFEPPDRTGLGLELDEDRLRDHPARVPFAAAPVREDGSIALR